MTLKIVGSAVEPEPFDFTITLDPNVNAFFGDVNGDGKAGLSDIFSTITLSADRRTITYSDGLIPVGGRFTHRLPLLDDRQRRAVQSRGLHLLRRFPGRARARDVGDPARGPGSGCHRAAAIDAEIFQDAYLAPLKPESEIYLIPKIGGG